MMSEMSFYLFIGVYMFKFNNYYHLSLSLYFLLFLGSWLGFSGGGIVGTGEFFLLEGLHLLEYCCAEGLDG